MLVLSRRAGQSIMIGDEIVVEVLRVKPDGAVQVGIIAPPNVSVHRQEVYDLIKATPPENPPVAEAEATARETDGMQ